MRYTNNEALIFIKGVLVGIFGSIGVATIIIELSK